jgi:hypothetical protein
MEKAFGPKRKTFRDKYLAVTIAAALLISSFAGHAQIFKNPNPGLFGVTTTRSSTDSTLYLVTSCGVPTDSSFLFSYGFGGQGQILKKAAIYYDTCGHHGYFWDPSLKAWHIVDSSSGGGAGSGSADSLKHLFVDTGASARNAYYLGFDSVNRKWKLYAPGSGGSPTDTSNISSRIDTISAKLAISITSLRALNIPQFVGAAYYITDRYKQGYCYYDPTDGTTVDDGAICFVDAGGHRFKRLFSGPANVMWWGAIPDGTTNSTTALQNAIDWNSSNSMGVHSLYWPSGISGTGRYMVDTLTFKIGEMYGDNMRTRIGAITGSRKYLIGIVPGITDKWGFGNFEIIGNSANTGQGAFNYTALSQASSPFDGGAWHFHSSNVKIQGFSGPGIMLDANDAVNTGDVVNQFMSFDTWKIDATADTTSIPVYIKGQMSQVDFFKLEILGAGKTNMNTYGIYAKSYLTSNDQVNGAVNFRAPVIQNVWEGVKLDYAQGVNVTEGYFEQDSFGVEGINTSRANVERNTFKNVSGTIYLESDQSVINFNYNHLLGTFSRIFSSRTGSPGGGTRIGNTFANNSNWVSVFGTPQIALSSGVINCGQFNHVLVNVTTSTSAVLQTINANMGPGEVLYVTAIDQSNIDGALRIVGTNNINIGKYSNNGSIILRKGQTAILTRADAPNTWVLTGLNQPPIYMPSLPTQGAWFNGEVIYDSVVTHTSPFAWVVKVTGVFSGTPPVFDSVMMSGSLDAKMTNFGNAPGQLQGTFAGIPAATSYANGTTYIAQDSGFLYVDTGSGGSRGWKKMIGGGGSSGSASVDSVLLIGRGIPPSGLGVNGNRYWNQQTSFMYRKAAGAWSYFSKLMADSTKMNDSSLWQGPIIKVRDWNTLGQDWNTGAIQRNKDAPGNAPLPIYKDDPVYSYGWNTEINGGRADPSKAYHTWQHEANYATNPFSSIPYYEDHISLGFTPGSRAYNWFFNAANGVIRVESWLLSQGDVDAYKYNTKSREFWQWADSGKANYYTYLTAQPAGLSFLRKWAVDSVRGGTNFMFINNYGVGQLDSVGGIPYYSWNKSGFNDTARLATTSGGNFVFKVNTGTNNVAFNAAAFSFGSSAVSQTTSPVWFNNQGFMQINSGTGKSFLYNFDGQTSGIGINTSARLGHSYLDIRNSDLSQYFNMLFKNNIMLSDSAANSVNFNIQKTYFGSYTNAALISGRGWKFSLNGNEYGNGEVAAYLTRFNGNQDANSRYLADHVWTTTSTGASSATDKMRLNNNGNLLIGRATDTLGSKLSVSGKTFLSDTLNMAVLPTGSTGDSVLVVKSDHTIGKVAQSSIGGGGGGGSTAIRVSPIDSTTKSANGIQVFAGKDIMAQTADASFPGLVSATTQTFAGVKTMPAPKFTGLTTAPSTKKVLMVDSTNGQTYWDAPTTPVGLGNLGAGWPVSMVRNDSALIKSIKGVNGIVVSSDADSSLKIDGSGIASSGAYVPVIANTTNVNSSMVDSFFYMRTGRFCHVTAYVVINVSANNTTTVFSFTTPISSILNSNDILSASFSVQNPDGTFTSGITGRYGPGSALCRATFTCGAGTTTTESTYVRFDFTYKLN